MPCPVDRWFRRYTRALIAAVALFALELPASRAQLPAPPATTEDALHQMLDQAGAVFTGQVTAIRRTGAIIQIDFAVDDAVLGVATGATYTLREWAGLALNADSTFAIGHRYLMFLHAPGPGGLSSPVGGPDGAIPILPANEAASPNTPDTSGLAAQTASAQSTQSTGNTASLLPRSPARTTFRLSLITDLPASPQQKVSPTSSISAALSTSTIDLRWIAAHVLTPVAYAADGNSPGALVAVGPPIVRSQVIANVAPSGSGSTSHVAGNVIDSAGAAASQGATTCTSYSALLATLRSWEQDRAAR